MTSIYVYSPQSLHSVLISSGIVGCCKDEPQRLHLEYPGKPNMFVTTFSEIDRSVSLARTIRDPIQFHPQWNEVT